jgi:hypothetical protein
MSRYRVWINDSAGIHTPSHPFGTRRAAEVFAAHRSRFRVDCFVIVARDNQVSPAGRPLWLVIYQGGHLKDSMVNGAFDPERVHIQIENGATVYALAQKRSA